MSLLSLHASVCVCSHGVQVTKKYYVKIFSLMDAKKAKETTDMLCNLQMSDAWNTLDSDLPPDEAGYESPSTTLHLSDVCDSDSSPRKKKKLGRSTPTRRGGPWCEADEKLLVAGVQGVPADVMKRWIRVLAIIQPDLRNPNRTPENLKDKYRNIVKFKSHLIGMFLAPSLDLPVLSQCVIFIRLNSLGHIIARVDVYVQIQ
jgi:hypothetical protein